MTLSEFLSSSRLSHADFAGQIGVSKEAVRLWVTGARTPRPAAMSQITKATKGSVTANDFVPADEAAA